MRYKAEQELAISCPESPTGKSQNGEIRRPAGPSSGWNHCQMLLLEMLLASIIFISDRSVEGEVVTFGILPSTELFESLADMMCQKARSNCVWKSTPIHCKEGLSSRFHYTLLLPRRFREFNYQQYGSNYWVLSHHSRHREPCTDCTSAKERRCWDYWGNHSSKPRRTVHDGEMRNDLGQCVPSRVGLDLPTRATWHFWAVLCPLLTTVQVQLARSETRE